MRSRTGRALAVAGAVLATLLVGPWSAAHWSTSGTGSGSAASGDATAALVVGVGTPSSQVWPGGSSDVALTLSNPNTAPVHISSLVLDTSRGTGGFTVDAGHSGCPVASLGFATQTNAGTGWTVPKRSGAVDGQLPLSLSGSLTMTVGAANACQGATFSVYLSGTP